MVEHLLAKHGCELALSGVPGDVLLPAQLEHARDVLDQLGARSYTTR